MFCYQVHPTSSSYDYRNVNKTFVLPTKKRKYLQMKREGLFKLLKSAFVKRDKMVRTISRIFITIFPQFWESVFGDNEWWNGSQWSIRMEMRSKISLICWVLHRSLCYHGVIPRRFVEIKERNTPRINAESNNKDAQAVHDEAHFHLQMKAICFDY